MSLMPDSDEYHKGATDAKLVTLFHTMERLEVRSTNSK